MDKEKQKQIYRRYYLKHKEEHHKRCHRVFQKKYGDYLWRSAKGRAKQKGLEFSIDKSDIVIPEICPFLKTTITRTFGAGKVRTNASIDRIDSTKGYIKGNVQVISLLANRMKQDASEEELITFARSILEILDNG